MANDRLFQFNYTYERDIVTLYARLTVTNGSGAVTMTHSKGINSITRNSAGDYTLALKSNFNLLMAAEMVTINSTGISASPNLGVKLDHVATAGAPAVEIVMSSGGVATDPASGDIILIKLQCRNAST